MPSLFERMTQLVHFPVRGDPRSALLSATTHLDAPPGVYDRRGRIGKGSGSGATARLIGVQLNNGLPAGKMTAS
jgi:hypothetical protein